LSDFKNVFHEFSLLIKLSGNVVEVSIGLGLDLKNTFSYFNELTFGLVIS